MKPITDLAARGRMMCGRRPAFVGLTMLSVWLVASCGPGDGPALVFDSIPPSTSTTAPLTTDISGSPSTDPVATLGPWVDVTANLAGLPSECGNLSYVAANPANDQVIAGVALQGLWANDAATGQWTKLGGGGAAVKNRAASITFDPGAPDRFWESGHYSGPGAVRTTDGGRTFQPLGDISHLDGISVDFSDPQRRTLLAGSHERGDLFLSTDGGTSWSNLAAKLPAGIGFASQPLVVDAQTFLLGTFNGDASGIFRTTDGGTTWSKVEDGPIFGTPLVASDGSIYWLLQNGGGVVRSVDAGATWTLVIGGGTLASYDVVELADGRLASLGHTRVIVSDDGGASWGGLGPELPPNGAYGLTYSESLNAIYIWQFDCGDVVQPGSVQRLDLSSPSG